MLNWLKHPKDKILHHGQYVDALGCYVFIVTVSRHNDKGVLEGYIVRIRDFKGYENIYFKKGYRHVFNVVWLAGLDYRLDNGINPLDRKKIDHSKLKQKFKIM